MIKTFLYGRLTADPRLSDKANCCNLSVAADSAALVEGKPKTEFFNITVWGKKGESCAQYLKKGDAVIVTGDYASNDYKSRDGETRYSFNILNADVQFGAKANRDSTQTSAPAPAHATPEVSEDELPF